MFKRFFVSFFLFFCLAHSLANAAAINKQVADSFSAQAQELSSTSIYPYNQTNAIFTLMSENELWIKNVFGDDFHNFYTKKVKNKSRKSNTLNMDFHLRSLPKSIIRTDKQRNSYVEMNKIRIQILDVPDVQFSDEAYPWNAANISSVGLGTNYQQFVDDAILAGNTYKEFWTGEETTAFEDFIDEHFGFHDSALIRYLILLAGILFVMMAYIFKPKIIELIQSD